MPIDLEFYTRSENTLQKALLHISSSTVGIVVSLMIVTTGLWSKFYVANRQPTLAKIPSTFNVGNLGLLLCVVGSYDSPSFPFFWS